MERPVPLAAQIPIAVRPMTFWASLLPWVRETNMVVTISRMRIRRSHTMVARRRSLCSSFCSTQPNTKPRTGESTMAATTLIINAFQWTAPAPQAQTMQPTREPMREWEALEGSLTIHVTMFQAMLPRNAAMMKRQAALSPAPRIRSASIMSAPTV